MTLSNDDYQLIELETDGSALIVRFNRPEVANALNTETMRELERLFGWLAEGDHAHRCVIITGAGDKAFCSGGDLKERNGFDTEAWTQQHRIMERAMAHLQDIPIPVIAAVNGAAFGGGCEIALACDFAYATTSARFALTETSLGIMPGAGGTQNLPRAVGTRRAKELIFSAARFSAWEALDWGMLNGVCSSAELMPTVLERAHRICANGPLAIRQAKKSIDGGRDLPLRAALLFEVDAYNLLVDTDDRSEGVRAFNEKRAPRFQGR